MIINKDMTLEELKSIASENNVSFGEDISKEELFSLLESKVEEAKPEATTEENNAVVEEVESTEVEQETVVVENTEVEQAVEEVDAVETQISSTLEDSNDFESSIQEEPKKKSKKGLVIIIILASLILLGGIAAGVTLVLMNNKTYEIEKRAEAKNAKEFYEVIESFDDTYSDVLSTGFVTVDSSLSIEEQRDRVKELYGFGEEMTTELAEITMYIYDCEKDFKITEDELKELKSMIEDFEEKWGE